MSDKRRRAQGITVECIRCKDRKTISFDEAQKLAGPPFCDRCAMPMIAVEARL